MPNTLEIMQELVKEDLELMKEVLEEDLVPLLRFREQLEKKEFERALKELDELDE